MSPQIILGPRPGKKSTDAIQARGVTNIVTLLSMREQPDAIQKIAATLSAHWHHFIVDGGHLDSLRSLDIATLFSLYDSIAEDNPAAVIYLHCSAGIHRTGFVTYLLLRHRGLNAEEAETELARLRPVTADQVGSDRLALAEEMFEIWQSGKN